MLEVVAEAGVEAGVDNGTRVGEEAEQFEEIAMVVGTRGQMSSVAAATSIGVSRRAGTSVSPVNPLARVAKSRRRWAGTSLGAVTPRWGVGRRTTGQVYSRVVSRAVGARSGERGVAGRSQVGRTELGLGQLEVEHMRRARRQSIGCIRSAPARGPAQVRRRGVLALETVAEMYDAR